MYEAASSRYDEMTYNRCGKSGLKLPVLSLGLWQNFGFDVSMSSIKERLFTAFNLGINHFDLANNYGPPYGSAEENFGKVMKDDLRPYRDELIISSKAGYDMWPGPYGEWGSRKNLLASLDQSLDRMGLEYVDIFYSHRFDPETPLEETMGALATAVKQGKALYVGISSYSAEKTREAASILKEMGIPLLIHQPSYSLLNRWVEGGLLDTLTETGTGCIAFSPLAQGMLTDKYLNGVPEGSRASKEGSFKSSFLNQENIKRLNGLNDIAGKRGQSLAQMSLAWAARRPEVTSVLIGASSSEQIIENLKAFENPEFSREELDAIDVFAKEAGINLWAKSSDAG